MSSEIVRARTSKAPRKIPGNTNELFTWLAKSLRPVATMRAPASLASQGQISGTGLAQANTMASLAMPAIHSGLMMPPAEKAAQTSAPRSASWIPPVSPSGFVCRQTAHCSQYSSCRSS